MNTIRQLAMQWSNDLLPANKDYLMSVYHNNSGRDFSDLTGREIENIFYQEVILKWFQNSYYSKITDSKEGYKANLLQAQDIIELYLKEHTKELPNCEYCGGDGIYIDNDSNRLKCPMCENGKSLNFEQPQSVLKTIDVEEESLESKVRNLFSPIKNYISVSRVLLSNSDDDEKVKLVQKEGLRADQNIYTIISEVHNASQPKAIEDNVWAEMWKSYINDKNIETYSISTFLEFLKQHYTLIKK